jgi:hypothetical protein
MGAIGYGNAMNVQRTFRAYGRGGAAATSQGPAGYRG